VGARYANFVKGTLQQSVAVGGTTIYIEAAEQAKLPALGAGDYVVAVLYDQDLAPEIVHITAHAAGALTVTRARESTAAQAWPAGTILTVDITAALVDLLASLSSLARYTGTATGTNDITVTATAGASVPTPTNGDEIFFQVANDNTDAATVTFTNGVTTIGPTALVRPDNTPLEPGELQAGWWASIRYHTGFSKWVLENLASYQLHAERINDGPLAPANFLSNGAFRSWKNGTSFVDPASGTEVADGYYIEYDGTIGNFTISRQTFTPGQTDVAGNPDYYLRWAHTAAGVGSTYRRLRTKVGRVNRFSGEKGIRTIYAKADSARNVTAKFIQYFGTGGAPSADVEAESLVLALTANWQRFEIPESAFPSTAGKTLGSNLDDALILSLNLPVNTTMTIEFAMDQFEFGHLATDPHGEWPLGTEKGGTSRSYASWTALVAGLYTDLNATWAAAYPDLVLVEAVSSSGMVFRNNTGPAWGTRTLSVGGVGLSIADGDGLAGNPTFTLNAALQLYAAITPSADIQTFLGAANYAAMRTQLGLVIGTNVQAWDAQLDTWATLTPSANAQSLITAADYAAMKALLDLEAGTDFYSIAAADTAISTAISNHVAAGDPHTQYALYTEVVGKHHIPIPASAMVANTTNGAVATVTETTTHDVMLSTFNFDQTTQEGVQFSFPAPKSWNESTVTFQPIWTADSGAGGVVWSLRGLALSNDDAADTAWGTEQTSSDTLLATGDIHVGPESAAITLGGTPAEGDMLFFQVRRNPADGGDTLNADARLLGVRLILTTTAPTDD
jgi:hypothetical protein